MEDRNGEGQEKTLVPLQVALVEINGERLVLVPLRQFCQHLGVDWSAQRRVVMRDES